MAKANHKNCWEHLKCPEDRKVQCPAYTKQRGGDCWKVEKTLCRGELQGTMAQKIGSCRKCDYYLTKHAMGISLRAKLMLSFSVLIALLVIVSGITIYQMNSTAHSYDTLIEGRGQVALYTKDTIILFQENAISLRTYLLTGQSDYLDRYKGNLSRIDQQFEQLHSMLRTEEGKKRYGEFHARYVEFLTYAEGAIKIKEQALKDPSIDFTAETSRHMDSHKGIVRGVTDAGKSLSTFAAELMSTGHKENKAKGTSIIMICIIITVVAAVIGLGIALYMSRMIANPVKMVEACASRVAAGDLTVDEIKIKNRDEIGLLSVAFNQMVVSLKDIASQLKEKSQQVAASAQQLTSNSEQMTAVTMENSSTISQLASTVDSVASDAQQVAGASDSAVKLAEEGAKAVEKVTTQMGLISSSSNTVGQRINSLGQKSNEISQIVELITQIADQTNLLALNAAIEAARAGEAGRGFAVVAEEVRKLAEQSADAAKDIKDLIGTIQNESTEAVQAMLEGSREVEAGNVVVANVGEAFKGIISTITNLTEQVHTVAAASQEMSAGIQNVAGTVEEQSASMEEVAAAAASLSKMSEDLDDLANRFKV